jgi:carbon monoxide dehydrogenase subunit G
MLVKISVASVLVLGALAGYIASRPSDFRISRSRPVAAPPDVVHAYVNDLHKWREWSPWETLDPALKREYAGAPAGPGAMYSWWGNRQVGEGRMTITDSRAPQSITIRLEFFKPWRGTNTAQFDFAPSGSGTNVTWTMTGRSNFMAKTFGLFMDMDTMIGSHFEKGLANLDASTTAAVASRSGGDRS